MSDALKTGPPKPTQKNPGPDDKPGVDKTSSQVTDTSSSSVLIQPERSSSAASHAVSSSSEVKDGSVEFWQNLIATAGLDADAATIKKYAETLSGQKYKERHFGQLTKAELESLGFLRGDAADFRKALDELENPGATGVKPTAAVNSELSNFWRRLTEAQLLDFDDQGRQLVFPEGVYVLGWADQGSRVFVRKCYEALYDKIMEIFRSCDGIVLSGSPGIGKTMMEALVLYKMRERKCTVVYERRMGGNSVVRYVMRPDGTIHVAAHSTDAVLVTALENVGNFYLVDAGTPPGEPLRDGVRCQTLVVASPDLAHFKEFFKKHKVKLFMPAWSYAELEGCRRLCHPTQSEDPKAVLRRSIPADAVLRRFNLYGGFPRWCLAEGEVAVADGRISSELQSYVDRCTLEDLLDLAGRIDVDGKSHGFHTVLVLRVSDDYERSSLDFASPEVFRRLVDRSVKRNRDALRKFVVSSAGEASLAVIRGKAMESVAHEELPRGGQYRARRLFVDRSPGSVTLLTLPKTDVHPIPLASQLDAVISKLGGRSGVYLKPTSERFPAFDALVTPDIGFQMTVDVNHMINLAAYANVRKALRLQDARALQLYIVTTPDKFFKFSRAMPFCFTKKQRVPPETAPTNAEQWVLELPFAGMEPFKDEGAYQVSALKLQAAGDDAKMEDEDDPSTSSSEKNSRGHCCRCTKGDCSNCKCKKAGESCADCNPGLLSQCRNPANIFY